MYVLIKEGIRWCVFSPAEIFQNFCLGSAGYSKHTDWQRGEMGNRGLVLFVICARDYMKKRNKKNNSHFSNVQALFKSKYSLYWQEQQTTSTSHFHLIYMGVWHDRFKGNLCSIAPGYASPHIQHAYAHRHSCIMCWQVTEKFSKHTWNISHT